MLPAVTSGVCRPSRTTVAVTESRLRVLHLVRDEIPDIRRSRRRTRTTKVEKILVLRKLAGPAPAHHSRRDE